MSDCAVQAPGTVCDPDAALQTAAAQVLVRVVLAALGQHDKQPAHVICLIRLWQLRKNLSHDRPFVLYDITHPSDCVRVLCPCPKHLRQDMEWWALPLPVSGVRPMRADNGGHGPQGSAAHNGLP